MGLSLSSLLSLIFFLSSSSSFLPNRQSNMISALVIIYCANAAHAAGSYFQTTKVLDIVKLGLRRGDGQELLVIQPPANGRSPVPPWVKTGCGLDGIESWMSTRLEVDTVFKLIKLAELKTSDSSEPQPCWEVAFHEGHLADELFVISKADMLTCTVPSDYESEEDP